MRDQRAEALAQILVRYSTRVQKGDVCVIQSTSAAEVLVQAVYEEVLRAGGSPDHPALHRPARSRPSTSWPRTTSSTGSRPRRSGSRSESDVRIVIMADVNPRELQHARPGEPGAGAEGAQAADGRDA